MSDEHRFIVRDDGIHVANEFLGELVGYYQKATTMALDKIIGEGAEFPNREEAARRIGLGATIDYAVYHWINGMRGIGFETVLPSDSPYRLGTVSVFDSDGLVTTEFAVWLSEAATKYAALWSKDHPTPNEVEKSAMNAAVASLIANTALRAQREPIEEKRHEQGETQGTGPAV